jgi:hypothetical protein
VSEAPKRIWAFQDGPLVGYFVGQSPGEGAYAVEYIRADLVEAAIKRALEGAASLAQNAYLVPPDGGSPTEAEEAVCLAAADYISALDPAQFIEEEKG